MYFKKFTAIILIWVLMFSLTACNDIKDIPEESADENRKVITDLSEWKGFGFYELSRTYYESSDGYKGKHLVFDYSAADDSGSRILGYDWENKEGYSVEEYTQREAEGYGIEGYLIFDYDGTEVGYYVDISEIAGSICYNWNYISAYDNHLIKLQEAVPAEEMQIPGTNIYYYLPRFCSGKAYTGNELVYEWKVPKDRVANFVDGEIYIDNREVKNKKGILDLYREYYGRDPVEHMEKTVLGNTYLLVTKESETWAGKKYPCLDCLFCYDGKVIEFFFWEYEDPNWPSNSGEAVLNSLFLK